MDILQALILMAFLLLIILIVLLIALVFAPRRKREDVDEDIIRIKRQIKDR